MIRGVPPADVLRSTNNVLLDELVDKVEVSSLGNGVVVVAIRYLFPDNSLGFAHPEELFHVRWPRYGVNLPPQHGSI